MGERKRRIIGLMGPAGSGKSTIAQGICDGFKFSQASFADPIKSMLYCIGVDGRTSHKNIPLDRLCGKTVREVLLSLGTKWGRDSVGEDLWVNMLRFTLVEGQLRDANVVVDDVRMDNEAKMLLDLGADLYRIERPGVRATINHLTEQQFDNIQARYNIPTVYNEHQIYEYRHWLKETFCV